MKTWLPVASLAVLLTACGGDGSESPSNKTAAQAMRMADTVPVAPHASAEYIPLAQNLYIGFFGRPADVAGLEYWTSIFSDRNLPLTFPEWVAGYHSNADIKSILDALSNSLEAQDLYVSNNTSFINAVYQNGFNRYAETGGREFWASLIDRGLMTRAQAVLSILSAAQDGNADGAILALKTQAAAILTSLLEESATRRLAYGVGGYSDNARDLLGRITASTDMSAFRVEIEAFAALLDVADASLPAVRRYVGYHYLQDMNNAPLYAATYRYQPLVNIGLPTSGSLTYGVEPQTIGWTRSDSAGWSYAAPFTGSMAVASVNRLPAMAMLCRPAETANGATTKSTDVLVARNTRRLQDAAGLANQRFTVYRENCAIGGSNRPSLAFDANGATSFPVGSGTVTIDAAAVTNILNGQTLFDLSTGKFLVFAAYGYTRTDGSNGYFIIQHLGNHKTGVNDGVLAVWAQE